MKLEKNKTYNVLESCGMFVLRGQLVGYVGGEHDMGGTLIFKNEEPRSVNSSKYFGAKWEIGGTITNPILGLRSCSYGDSPQTLKRVGSYYDLPITLFEE